MFLRLKMNKFNKFLFIILIIITSTVFGTIYIIKNTSIEEVDTVAVNDIIQETKNSFNALYNLDSKDFKYDFTVIDCNENVIYSKGTTQYTSIESAIKSHNIIYTLNTNNEQSGSIIIFTNTAKNMYEFRNAVCKIIITLYILIIAIITVYYYYLYKNIIKPFNNLKSFAHQISIGNLDAPLSMDKNNIFGAFTSSFDIMREELNKSKKQEYLANQSKKELVASLSHDIKTPITSIKLLSELLSVMIKEDKIKDKISTIYNKADEIDHLVSDMFTSTLEELQRLKVNVTDNYSISLKDILKNADYNNKIILGDIPPCVIKFDPLRLQQVVNNIIVNSYKYADTAIDVIFTLEKYNLIIGIKDYGPGIPEDELPLIFNKFYRGKNSAATKQNGSGLGLYIAKYLMNEMSGDISCSNEIDGFKVEIWLQLT